MVASVDLTRRQRECLQGVADHLDSQQIAERLGISPYTVDRHIEAAIAKIGARSRRDAVRILLAAGDPLTSDFPAVERDAVSEEQSASGVVREAPVAPYEFGSADAFPASSSGRSTHHDLNPLRTVLLIIAVAAALTILLLAAEPLTNSAVHLANVIHPMKD